MTEGPIIVSATPGPNQRVVAVRQFLIAAGGAVGALGFTHLGTDLGIAATMVGPTVALVTAFFGQMHERHQAQRAAFMADKLPDEIAMVRRP